MPATGVASPNASIASPVLAAVQPTKAQLLAWVGKNIKDVCKNGYTNNSDNHCAHFVSHILGFAFGYTCTAATGKSGPSACLRVHEVFSKCLEVGAWDKRPASLNCCLAFVTKMANVDVNAKTMVNVPRKHIGIFLDTHIWHYSNSKDEVVSVLPNEFKLHYSGKGYGVFYGKYR